MQSAKAKKQDKNKIYSHLYNFMKK